MNQLQHRETKFKSRSANHEKPLKNRKYKTDLELSNEIWELQEKKKNVDTWEILETHQFYKTITK